MTRIDANTLYGTLNVLILKALSDSPRHGLEISRIIKRESDEMLKVEEGALYPALHRLERDGMLESTWGVSDNNRRAKFYGLTESGRTRLAQEIASWNRHATAVSRVLNTALGDR